MIFGDKEHCRWLREHEPVEGFARALVRGGLPEGASVGTVLVHAAAGEVAKAAYRWSTPLEWLAEKAGEWDAVELQQELLSMAQTIGFDAIQELYESDMAKDGYFEKVGADNDE